MLLKYTSWREKINVPMDYRGDVSLTVHLFVCIADNLWRHPLPRRISSMRKSNHFP